MIQAKATVYHDINFRSRLEIRWVVFFDSLSIQWAYEPQHYDFGVKRHWDDDEFREHLNEVLSETWGEDEGDVIRWEYRKRYEKHMYLPDFYLPELDHWVEIKGKSPAYEEQEKARKLACRTSMPVSILWGNIPDPKVDTLGECTEIYGGDMKIIALIVLEYGLNAVIRALTSARQARF